MIDAETGIPLPGAGLIVPEGRHAARRLPTLQRVSPSVPQQAAEIGRASCRERVCQYVSISVVAVYLAKKQSPHTANAGKSHMQRTSVQVPIDPSTTSISHSKTIN